MTKNKVKTADCKSIGIRIEAEKAGIDEIELLADNGKFGDARIEIYQVGPAMAYAYADALLKAKRNGNKQTAKEADRNPRNSAKADPISTYVRSLVPK